jgi:hypothetical protein
MFKPPPAEVHGAFHVLQLAETVHQFGNCVKLAAIEHCRRARLQLMLRSKK